MKNAGLVLLGVALGIGTILLTSETLENRVVGTYQLQVVNQGGAPFAAILDTRDGSTQSHPLLIGHWDVSGNQMK